MGEERYHERRVAGYLASPLSLFDMATNDWRSARIIERHAMKSDVPAHKLAALLRASSDCQRYYSLADLAFAARHDMMAEPALVNWASQIDSWLAGVRFQASAVHREYRHLVQTSLLTPCEGLQDNYEDVP